MTEEKKPAYVMSVSSTCTACGFHGAQDECEVCGGEVDYIQRLPIPPEVVAQIAHEAVRSKELDRLKREAHGAIDEAVKRASLYAKELDVGEERYRWFDAVEKIRRAAFLN